MKPAWLIQILDYLKEENMKYRKYHVIDTFLESAALSMGKQVEAIEEPIDQCDPLNTLSKQQVSDMIDN